MLSVLLSLVLALGAPAQVVVPASPAQGQPRDQVPKPAVGTSSISGRVVTGDTGLPIRRAIVSVNQAMTIGSTTPGGAPARRSVMTDVDGRFAATGLPAGTYTLSVQPGPTRVQYLGTTYGTTAPGTRPQMIEVAAGQQVSDITVPLPRAGVISGVVTDDGGEPVGRVQVSALIVRRGSEPMQMSNSSQTDDQGRYRMFGLQPGEYVISVDPRNNMMGPSQELQGEAVGFARSFAPGTPVLAQAQRIRISRGTEATADVRLSEARLFTITGTILDSSGQPARGASISVSPSDSPTMGGLSYSMMNNGQFVVRAVPPGRYDITARIDPARAQMMMQGGPGVPPPPPPPPSQAPEVDFGMVTVDVMSNVDGVVVMAQHGAVVKGEFVFEEPAEGKRASVSASPVARPPGMMVSPTTADVTETSFTLRNLFFPVLVRGNVGGAGWGLKAVLLNGRDITDEPTLFTSKDSGHLKVVFTSKAPTLEGTVTDDSGKPTRDAMVILFGRDEKTWVTRSSMTRTGAPDKDGKFTIRGLREGEYFAIALAVGSEGFIQGPPTDAEQLAEYAKVATRVTLNAGETRSIDLKLVKIE